MQPRRATRLGLETACSTGVGWHQWLAASVFTLSIMVDGVQQTQKQHSPRIPTPFANGEPKEDPARALPENHLGPKHRKKHGRLPI